MDEMTVEKIVESTNRLVQAAEALQQALTQLSAQQQEISVKVDKIVAGIEEGTQPALSAKVAERTGHPDPPRSGPGTLSPMVTMILAKNGVDDGTDAAVLDKALNGLSPEQRIAVKSEMARAGIIQ